MQYQSLYKTTAFILGAFLLPTLAQASEIGVDVREPKISPSHYELEMSTSLKATQGGFNQYGEYVGYPDGSNAYTLTTTFGFAYRFNQQWETVLTLPIKRSSQDFPTGSTRSTSVGGAGGTVKFHISGWAHPDIHAGFGSPWKYNKTATAGDPKASLSPDSGDSTPPGASIPVGVGFSHSFSKFRLAFDSTYTFILPNDQNLSDAPPGYPQVAVKAANRIKISQGVAYQLSKEWKLNAGTSQQWSGNTQADGTEIAGTASRVYMTKLGASFSPTGQWRYSLTYETLFPFYAYAANQTFGPGVALMISFVGGS